MSEPGIMPASTAAQPPEAAIATTARPAPARKAVSAGDWCAVGDAAGYVLGGPGAAGRPVSQVTAYGRDCGAGGLVVAAGIEGDRATRVGTTTRSWRR
jgi:hypothetical protein